MKTYPLNFLQWAQFSIWLATMKVTCEDLLLRERWKQMGKLSPMEKAWYNSFFLLLLELEIQELFLLFSGVLCFPSKKKRRGAHKFILLPREEGDGHAIQLKLFSVVFVSIPSWDKISILSKHTYVYWMRLAQKRNTRY